MTKNVWRVVVADDHALFREGLVGLLSRLPEVEVVAEAANGVELIQCVSETHPDLALVDVSMPRLNGMDAMERLATEFPRLAIIMLSMHDEESYVLRCLRGGASGYLTKDVGLDELRFAIQSVMTGGVFLSPRVSRVVVNALRPGAAHTPSAVDRLTPRQREVVQLIAEGHSTRSIAEAVHISPKTVESHRRRAMQELGIREVSGLVRFAIRNGLTVA